MIRRLGFRLLLPVLNLTVFIALSALGVRSCSVALLFQEWTAGPLDICFSNPYYPLLTIPCLIAIAVNAPASFAAEILLHLAGIPNERFATWLVPAMYPFVALFWYLCGRWVDHQVAWLPPSTRPRRSIGILYVAAVVLAPLVLVHIWRVVYFLLGGVAGWHGETPFVAAWTYGFTVWLVWWELMLVSAIRQRKNTPLTPAAVSDSC